MINNNKSLNGDNTPSINGHAPELNGHLVNFDPAQITLPWVDKLLAEKATAKKESLEADTSIVVTKHVSKDQAGSADLKAVKKKRARNRESGHSSNVRNFAVLKQAVIGFGPDYVSPNPLYALANLELIYTEANQSIEKVTNKKSLYGIDIDAQTMAYKQLKKDSTRTKNMFTICDVPVEAIKRMESINNLIQGERIIKLKKNDTKDRVSTSHQSKANQISHVNELLELLDAYPQYSAPADISVAAWTSKRDAMASTLDAVTVTNNGLKMARLDRNKTIYAPTTGMIEVAYGVKKVVLAIFGSRSPQYRMVSGIEFSRINDYKNL
ncbi:MAG: hypothetical protein ACSHXF_13680 [Aquaticitalea sp.]